jgi:hypothetical protein
VASAWGVWWGAWSKIAPQDENLGEAVDEAVQDMRSDAEERQERSQALGDRIEQNRSDWHRKQQDAAVPGAQPPPDDHAEHPPSKPT